MHILMRISDVSGTPGLLEAYHRCAGGKALLSSASGLAITLLFTVTVIYYVVLLPYLPGNEGFRAFQYPGTGS